MDLFYNSSVMVIKKFCRFLSALSVVIFLLSFFGCANKKQVYDFYAFNNTPVIVSVTGSYLSDQTQSEISSVLSRLETTFSATKKQSEIYLLNSAAENFTMPIDEETYYLFSKCFEYNALTSDKFNPAVYPLVKLWKFSPMVASDKFVPPQNSEVQALKESGAVSLNNFILKSDTTKTVSKSNANAMIDFGGILKGYASELIYDILIKAGVNKGYISIGSSSIKLINVSPCVIRHPRNTQDTILTINSANRVCAVSTSGDYERYYDYSGTRYSHIIDGKTGNPYDTGIISATVVSDNGTFCDAISTALCLSHFDVNNELQNDLTMLIKKIIDYNNNSDIYAIYNKNGIKRLITNKTQGKDFTLKDNSYSVIKI